MQVPVCSQRGSWSSILHVPGLSLTRLSLLPPQTWYHRKGRQPLQYTAAAHASLPSTTWLFSAGTLYCVPLFLMVSSRCCPPAQRRALLCQSCLASMLLDSIVRPGNFSIRVAASLTRSMGCRCCYMLQLMMPGSLDAGMSGQPASGVLILHIRPTRPPADVCSWCDNSAAQGKTGVCAAGGFRPQFFPSLEGIATLFSRATTAASLWVHLLAINLFAARSAYLEGEQSCCNLLPCILCGC